MGRGAFGGAGGAYAGVVEDGEGAGGGGEGGRGVEEGGRWVVMVGSCRCVVSGTWKCRWNKSGDEVEEVFARQPPP